MKDIINILITQRKFAKLPSITEDSIWASLHRAHAGFRAQLQCNNMREALITLLAVRPQEQCCPPVSSKCPCLFREARNLLHEPCARFKPINPRKRMWPFKPLVILFRFCMQSVCGQAFFFECHPTDESKAEKLNVPFKMSENDWMSQ